MTDFKIENVEQLLTHLTKLVAAYRKSYKLCGNISSSLKVVRGLIGCSAVLALVPAKPVVVAVAGAIPAGITVLLDKGIIKGVVKKKIVLEDYKETLFKILTMKHSMNTIRSNKHNLKSYTITKISLSCFDNKIFI